jgi:hypothetical protein
MYIMKRDMSKAPEGWTISREKGRWWGTHSRGMAFTSGRTKREVLRNIEAHTEYLARVLREGSD